MKTNKPKVKIIAIACLALSLQACAIPLLNWKKADAPLPEKFEKSQSKPLKESVALINWKDFFEDAQLTALINTAVANNKEVKQLLTRINMARNEIQARKGEYLPSVNVVAGAEGERSGEFTRNGAVEEQLEIKEGKAFPKFLGNYQLGLLQLLHNFITILLNLNLLRVKTS